MSAKHPIIVITGSSGAGTTSVMRTFEQIFRREQVNAALIEGDSFHRYDRTEMKAKVAEAFDRGDHGLSHFGPEANLFEELEELFRQYGENGRGRVRKYLHDEEEAAESFELPGADLSHVQLEVEGKPKQADEFTCTSCFLVHHRSQLAVEKNGQVICRDCH